MVSCFRLLCFCTVLVCFATGELFTTRCLPYLVVLFCANLSKTICVLHNFKVEGSLQDCWLTSLKTVQLPFVLQAVIS